MVITDPEENNQDNPGGEWSPCLGTMRGLVRLEKSNFLFFFAVPVHLKVTFYLLQ